MYVDAYMERKKGSELLHVVERVNSKRVMKQYQPVYEYYAESPHGTIQTINGTMAEKFEFDSYRAMKAQLELHAGRNIFESDCNVTFKTLSKYYNNASSPDLHVAFFDIETDFHKKFGYAPPHDPFNRVTAISLYQTWTGKDYVLTLPPQEMSKAEAQSIVDELNAETNNPDSIVILYDDEKEMFETFFELIDDADVLSGWNSEFFDIPYMVNRTAKIFNAAATARWCLWNKKPTPREADNFGKTVIVYDLIGRIHLDYLALYKKHAGQVEQSYKLEDIARKVTKQGKVPYEGSLDTLYRTNYKSFLEYSKQDSILLKLIDEQMDFISLHNRLAHKECVLISTTMGSVALIDTAIINLIHKRNEVVFDKKKQEDWSDESFSDYDYGQTNEDDDEDEPEETGTKAAGAWVQDPVLGLVEQVGVTDFNSLYPTILRTLGMSTELIIGQIRQIHTDNFLQNRIDEQRARSKSKKFEPKWTEAWHGLFSSVEFSMIHDKSNEILIVDMEDGTSFEATGAELHDIIFSKDSEIVMSANGTLFDRKRSGVIPEILTIWYSERKSQQKMVLDFKHLYTDGWKLDYSYDEVMPVLIAKGYDPKNHRIKQTNLHEECPIFHLRKNLSNLDSVCEIIIQNGLIYKEDGTLWCNESDVSYCKRQSAFWKQNQQIRKILLNSLYGALLNKGSRFFDKRLGQSVTLTGRTMTKHMAGSINEICTGTYNHEGGAVVYGDTDSVYFSVAHYFKLINQEFNLPKEDVIEMYKKIGDDMGATFPKFMDKMFNTGEEKGALVGADLEMVGSRGLFLKKKRYAILKYWEDGFRLDNEGPGKIKAMGIEIKRSDTPKYIQNFLEETLTALLVGESENELRVRVREFKSIFKDKPSKDKGSPKTVKNYSNKEEEYKVTGKCSTGHVLAAIQWNRLREIYDDKTVPEATDGTKVIVCKLKTNPLGIKTIGYPMDCAEYLPEWFNDLPFDDEGMEQSVLTKKLGNIFGLLDMDIGIEEKSNTQLNNGFFHW